MIRAKRLIGLLGLAPLLLVFGVGCGGTGSTKTSTVAITPPTGITLTASSGTITCGASTNLVPTFQGARDATIDNGVGPVLTGVPIAVSPSSNTTYTLTVTGVNLQVTTTTVAVAVAPAASITSFGIGTATGANFQQVSYGYTGTIVPVFAGGAGTIDGGIGPVVSGQAYPVGPLLTSQVYNLTVPNSIGDAAKATVTFNVAPVLIGGISPANPISRLGSSLNFSATISGSLDAGIVWSATGGQMNSGSGLLRRMLERLPSRQLLTPILRFRPVLK